MFRYRMLPLLAALLVLLPLTASAQSTIPKPSKKIVNINGDAMSRKYDTLEWFAIAALLAASLPAVADVPKPVCAPSPAQISVHWEIVNVPEADWNRLTAESGKAVRGSRHCGRHSKRGIIGPSAARRSQRRMA